MSPRVGPWLRDRGWMSLIHDPGIVAEDGNEMVEIVDRSRTFLIARRSGWTSARHTIGQGISCRFDSIAP